MDWACTAEQHKGELAWVVASLNGHQPDLVRHASVNDLVDSGCCGGHAEVELVREPSDRCLGGTDVQPKRAAGEALGVEVAEKHACVGHRGLIAAPAVACGSRLGPRAHGSDPQAAGRVAPGEAPTPGAHGLATH